MADAPRQPIPHEDQVREFEEWSRSASAEELADGVRAEWRHYSAGGVSGSRLATDERAMAFLYLRLVEQLVSAADRVTAASNSGTRTLGRLTVVYIALTAVIAMATVVGAGVAVHQAAPGRGGEIALGVAALSAAVVGMAGWLVFRLWPRG